ncbi:Bicaudal D protein [Fasciola gigantica]|uniref:Bicaudal D protein n=1 Tax=Fasciola gigantica TaxID=46835 RepID=A0A504YMJ7_FASGI|nr:Bicaudal D protein [Fasciola gigantica]
MDDDALLAYLKACSNESVMEQSVLKSSNELPAQQDSRDALIGELRDELGEIFQQMHQMCVEVQALNGAQTMAHRGALPNGGTHTPDELAIVEMDFRLSSLKSVLADLRGLVRELVMDTSSELTTSQVLIDVSESAVYSEEHKAMIEE